MTNVKSEWLWIKASFTICLIVCFHGWMDQCLFGFLLNLDGFIADICCFWFESCLKESVSCPPTTPLLKIVQFSYCCVVTANVTKVIDFLKKPNEMFDYNAHKSSIQLFKVDWIIFVSFLIPTFGLLFAAAIKLNDIKTKDCWPGEAIFP